LLKEKNDFTVSETVSGNCKTVRKNSGELKRILIETPMKPAIMLAMNR
jgi:hypothetical protein